MIFVACSQHFDSFLPLQSNGRLWNNCVVCEIIVMLSNYCFVGVVSFDWQVTWKTAHRVLLIARHQKYFSCRLPIHSFISINSSLWSIFLVSDVQLSCRMRCVLKVGFRYIPVCLHFKKMTCRRYRFLARAFFFFFFWLRRFLLISYVSYIWRHIISNPRLCVLKHILTCTREPAHGS